MTRLPHVARHFLGSLTLTLGSLGLVQAQAQAQDLPPTPNPAQEPMSLKPGAPMAIPTDPPPHEGALIDIPLTIEPPDILVVEALEGMPGRPITGERLVRPDGTISLGFYGDLHVRGLTLEQAKVKVVLHLRKFINDHTLGLIHTTVADADENGSDKVMPGSAPPPTGAGPDAPKAHDPQPSQSQPDLARPRQTTQSQRPRVRPVSARSSPLDPSSPLIPPQGSPDDDVAAAFRKLPRDPMEPGEVAVAPQDTNRVFVEIVSHNTKVYYVQGDVGTPGRLPVTGKETVLDAINFASGLIPTADPADIHLYRPSRGGQPARDYKIDLQAIWRGDAKANLQIFPNDRLIVGRNAIVKKTIEIDRAAALSHGILTQYTQLNNALRSVNPNEVNDNRLGLPEYFDIIWTKVADDPAILNDPDRFRDFMSGWLKQTRRPK